MKNDCSQWRYLSAKSMLAVHMLKQSPENSAEIAMCFMITETYFGTCVYVCQIVAEEIAISE